MMILVSKTYEIVTPESAENGEAEETGFRFENEPMTFRELVKALQYGEASSWPCDGDTRTWITHYDQDGDFRTGARTNESIHYSRLNPARNAKYWRLALKAAGYINS